MVRTKPPRAVVKCWFNTAGSVLPGLLNSPGLPWEDSPGSRFFPTGHYHLPGGELRPASSNKAEHRIRNPKVWVGVLAPWSVLVWCPPSPFTSPVSSTSPNRDYQHLLYQPHKEEQGQGFILLTSLWNKAKGLANSEVWSHALVLRKLKFEGLWEGLRRKSKTVVKSWEYWSKMDLNLNSLLWLFKTFFRQHLPSSSS